MTESGSELLRRSQSLLLPQQQHPPYLLGDRSCRACSITKGVATLTAHPSQDQAKQVTSRSSLAGVFAGLCAAIILFDAVLALGLGLDWAVVGLLHLSQEAAVAGAAVAVAAALAAGYWLFGRACEAERELSADERYR